VSTDNENSLSLEKKHSFIWFSDGLEGQSLIPGKDKTLVFSIASIAELWPNQPPVQWVLRVIILRIKQPGREADHSPPSSSEVKNGGDTHLLADMFSWHNVYLFTLHLNILYCGRKWSWPNLRDNSGS
jgi:hypothetical protein